METNSDLATTAIDTVTWSRLFHAYDVATDTPAHLRALADGGPDAVDAAVHHLSSAVMHQGTAWTATAPAARIVALLLPSPRFDADGGRIRAELLDFLGDVASVHEQLTDVEAARAFAYPADPARAAAIDVWLDAYLAAAAGPEGADGLIDPWDAADRPGDAVLTRGALECHEALPELYPTVAACLDDPSPVVRMAAAECAVQLAAHPALAGRRPELADGIARRLAGAGADERVALTAALEELAASA